MLNFSVGYSEIYLHGMRKKLHGIGFGKRLFSELNPWRKFQKPVAEMWPSCRRRMVKLQLKFNRMTAGILSQASFTLHPSPTDYQRKTGESFNIPISIFPILHILLQCRYGYIIHRQAQ